MGKKVPLLSTVNYNVQIIITTSSSSDANKIYRVAGEI